MTSATNVLAGSSHVAEAGSQDVDGREIIGHFAPGLDLCRRPTPPRRSRDFPRCFIAISRIDTGKTAGHPRQGEIDEDG